MKPEAQRIAIAEACGWVPTPVGNWTKEPSGIPSGVNPAFGQLPDYLSDLNAMHEAEKVLTEQQQAGYFLELQKLIVPPYLKHFAPCIVATATQRAEAFVKAIGEWEDDK